MNQMKITTSCGPRCHQMSGQTHNPKKIIKLPISKGFIETKFICVCVHLCVENIFTFVQKTATFQKEGVKKVQNNGMMCKT